MSKAYLCKCKNHHIVIVEEKHMKKEIFCSRCDELFIALEVIDTSRLHDMKSDNSKCHRGGVLNKNQIKMLGRMFRNHKELGMSICSCDVERVLDMNKESTNNNFNVNITVNDNSKDAVNKLIREIVKAVEHATKTM